MHAYLKESYRCRFRNGQFFGSSRNSIFSYLRLPRQELNIFFYNFYQWTVCWRLTFSWYRSFPKLIRLHTYIKVSRIKRVAEILPFEIFQKCEVGRRSVVSIHTSVLLTLMSLTGYLSSVKKINEYCINRDIGLTCDMHSYINAV